MRPITENWYKDLLMELYYSADLTIFVINHSDKASIPDAKSAVWESIKYIRDKPIPLAIVILYHSEEEENIENNTLTCLV